MKKIFKYMTVFSFWLAGLSLSAHMLLPHDHHISGSLSKQEENCPASDNRSGQKSGFPVHCLAFNDLASEKARPIQISQNIQFSFITFSILTDTSTFNLQRSCTSLNDFSKPIFDSYILEFSLLRAPPALA